METSTRRASLVYLSVMTTSLFGPLAPAVAAEPRTRPTGISPLPPGQHAKDAAARLHDRSRYGRSGRKVGLGQDEQGALADILVIEGNPLEDISILERSEEVLRLIMKDGRIHKLTLGLSPGI